MIYYFTGSGNSRYVAQRIGIALGISTAFIPKVSIDEPVEAQEPVGLVLPVYFYGIPTAALRFAERLRLSEQQYLFVVLTCGGTTADASGQLERALGRKADMVCSVVMPDSYVPMFSCNDAAKLDAILDAAEPEIDSCIDLLRQRKRGSYDRHRGLGGVMTALLYPSYRRKTTRAFAVTDACVGCGVCAEVCPDSMITLADGRPQWKEGHCELCFACLHHCPHHAIASASVASETASMSAPGRGEDMPRRGFGTVRNEIRAASKNSI